jgi:shikimate dehydrogenase
MEERAGFMNGAGISRKIRVGLIGAGIGHSASPRMHVDEAQALGLDYSYELLDLNTRRNGPADLASILQECENEGFTGVNITYPVKQSVLSLLTRLSPEARAVNAVNTVVFRSGERVGYNTDCLGFAESFRRGMRGADVSDVLLVGAGGAGAAAAYALLELGAGNLGIYDQDPRRSEELVAHLRQATPSAQVDVCQSLKGALERASGLVHATPTGMRAFPGLAVPEELVRPPLWVAEIVYVPLETELVALARRRGCRTLDGGGMAVFQAARAFELFTGVTPDPERMLKEFNQRLRGESPLAPI